MVLSLIHWYPILTKALQRLDRQALLILALMLSCQPLFLLIIVCKLKVCSKSTKIMYINICHLTNCLTIIFESCNLVSENSTGSKACLFIMYNFIHRIFHKGSCYLISLRQFDSLFYQVSILSVYQILFCSFNGNSHISYRSYFIASCSISSTQAALPQFGILNI